MSSASNIEHKLCSKIFTLCQKHRFLMPSYLKKNKNVSGFIYGPLGIHLKRNLLNEWWQMFVTKGENVIYPVSSQAVHKLTNNSNRETDSTLLLSSTLEHFPSLWEFNDKKLPFGIVQIGTCMGSKSLADGKENGMPGIDDPKHLADINIWHPFERTKIMLLFFCFPQKSSYYFNYWQRQQYLWWRKYAGDPSNFLLGELSKDEKARQAVQMEYKSPWGIQRVGSISNSGSKLLEQLSNLTNFDLTDDRIKAYPHVIECSFYVDSGLMAYLSDAYQEKTRSKNQRRVMRIHHKITPYKIAVCITMKENMAVAQVTKLNDLAEYIIKELKMVSIPLFMNPYLSSLEPLQSQFERFDEMGIPYTVVLTEDTILKGVVGLRNRDTTLQEEVHVSELMNTLLRYLQMSITVHS